MGEYAIYDGSEIKIGTLEDMYYLRADQAHLVTALPGNVDPVRHRDQIRFRFPFPDEDGVEPGAFGDHDRGLTVHIPGREVHRMIKPSDHYSVQFTAQQGYVVSLPCPEASAKGDGFTASEGVLSLTDGSDHAYRVGRNGFRGALFVKQQRWHEGRLVTVVKCACGAAWRLETLEQAEPVIVAIRAEADRENLTAERNGTPGNARTAERLHLIADRIAAGYQVAAEVPA
jgi:hypothetical protein